MPWAGAEDEDEGWAAMAAEWSLLREGRLKCSMRTAERSGRRRVVSQAWWVVVVLVVVRWGLVSGACPGDDMRLKAAAIWQAVSSTPNGSHRAPTGPQRPNHAKTRPERPANASDRATRVTAAVRTRPGAPGLASFVARGPRREGCAFRHVRDKDPARPLLDCRTFGGAWHGGDGGWDGRGRRAGPSLVKTTAAAHFHFHTPPRTTHHCPQTSCGGRTRNQEEGCVGLTCADRKDSQGVRNY